MLKYPASRRKNILQAKCGPGAWVAQSVKYLTLGFSSGHDLMVLWVRALHRALHWQRGVCLGFSHPLSLPLPCSPCLCLSQINE